MSEINVSVSKPAARDFTKIPVPYQKAFITYVEETLKKGEYSSLETEKFKSIDTSVFEVKVKGRPAGRMFYTTLLSGHIEILAFVTKSRFGQDPKIKATVEQRFKDFKSANGIK